MNLTDVINGVVILFLIMIAGYIANKFKIIDENINKGLSELLINITLPCLLITSFNFKYSTNMIHNAIIIFVSTTIILLALVIISKFIYYKYDLERKSVLRFATIFSNCGFMGYPIVQSVYGKMGVFYTAIFNASFTIVIWTVGVMIYTNKRDFKSIKKGVINPGVISIIIGLITFIFSINLPVPLFKACEIIGSSTTPISMMVIGSMLAQMKVSDIFSGGTIYYFSTVRLVVIPLLLFVIFNFIGMDKTLAGILILINAMPAAANTAIFAEKYGADASFASRCVFMTTIFSLITIPLIIVFIR